ncbi:MAG: hypothetical protein JST76_05430, partial [Bacteroidetes bacterium]|nr:hypothetical protein [Bacteroidota bacterium]
FAALIFVYGMGVWKERMRIMFEDFDYSWMAQHYGLTEQQARAAVIEMLDVIQKRLDGISAVSDIKQSLIEILKENNQRYDYEV